ncbi:hypothetical protein GCM10028805_19940 [Spirosoma harenae]
MGKVTSTAFRTPIYGLGLLFTIIYLLPGLGSSLGQQKFAVKELGFSQGNFRVSESGALTYTIPIQVVPGASGTQPAISIGYNHQAGEGMMGIGWSIQGLSAISRVPRNRANDESVSRRSLGRQFTFDRRDRFNLDGQLMVLTSEDVNAASNQLADGKYGLPKTSYYTEKNSFSKIIINDTLNNSPTCFTVYTNSGMIMEYGNTPDSRIEAQGKNIPVQWLVNKISDTKGNYILFKYKKDKTKGETLPSSIEYTGNDKAGVVPFASLVFQYENLPIATVKFQSGSQTTFSQRLSAVECRFKTDIVRKYSFKYELKPGYEKSYLTQIQESVGATMLDPLKITWKNDNPYIDYEREEALLNSNTLKRNDSKPRVAYFGDWDGDGLQDMMIHVLKSDHKYPIFYQSTKKPFDTAIFHQNLGSAEESEWRPIGGFISRRYSELPFDVPPPSLDETSNFVVTDFNADGKSDLIWYRPKDGLNYFYLNNSDGAKIRFVKQQFSGLTPPSNQFFTKAYELSVRDFNNDGLTDLIFYCKQGDGSVKNSVWQTVPSGGNQISGSSLQLSTFSDGLIQKANGWNIPIAKTDTSRIYFEDLNGDGLLDALAINNNQATKITSGPVDNGNVRIFPQRNYETIRNSQAVYTNEFDTKSLSPFEVPIVSIFVATGKPPKIVKNYDDILITDFNGDGLPDIFIYGFNKDARQFSFYVNNGDFIFSTPNNNPRILSDGRTVESVLPNSSYKIYVRDVNTDGLPDLLFSDDKTVLTCINLGGFRFQSPMPDFAKFNTKNVYLRGNFLGNGKQSEVYFDYDTGENKHRIPSKSDQKTNNVVVSIAEVFKQCNIKYTTIYDKDIFNNATLTEYKYPLTKGTIPLSVVSQLEVLTNLTFRTYSYTYQGAVMDLRGRGFRGFERMTTYDVGKNRTEIKFFDYAEDYRDDPLKRIAVYSGTGINTKLLSNNFFTPEINQGSVSRSYFTFPRQTQVVKYEPSTQKVNNSINTRQTVDFYGNVLSTVSDYGNGMVDSIANTYTNDEQNWFLGRLTKATIYKRMPGKPLQTNSSTFEYDKESGLLTKEISNADAGDEKLLKTKRYKHDVFGNIVESSIRAWNGKAWEERTTKTEMDALGRFIIKTTNSLGHSSTFKYDEKTGNALETTDPNKLTTKFEYDALGRKRKEILPDGNWTTQDFYYQDERIFGNPYECKTNCQRIFPYPFIAYVVYKQSSVGPPVVDYYDELNRNIGSKTTGFNGQTINKYRLYSPVKEAEINVEYNPFADGETPQETRFTYDEFGRLIKTDRPTNRSERIEYNGNTTTYINALNQRKIAVKNSKDNVIKVTDEQGNVLTYDYDANNNLLKTTDPKGNNLTAEYDFRGFKIKSTDPNLGTYQYEYNGFGELIRQINPRGHITEIEYDNLGRVKKQVEKEGTTTWSYDLGSRGVAFGKPTSVSYTAGNINTDYEYDNLQRLTAERKSIDGKTYVSRFTYDSNSRPNTYTYPSGFQVKYEYNLVGFLELIRRASDNQIVWRAKTFNARGQIGLQEFGNGTQTQYQFDQNTNELRKIEVSKGSQFVLNQQYSYDQISNLTERRELSKNKQERFTYDNLNRLTRSEVIGGSVVSVTYDILGNILFKSDVGSYDYGTTNKGPHQVINITPSSSATAVVCSPTIAVNTEYNSFNKVTKISNDTAYVDISYGVDKQRVMQRMYIRNKLVRTKIYVNNTFEVETTLQETREVHYLRAGNGVFGTFIKSDKGQSRTEYWHKDNLGSLVAITDEQGKVVVELSYDAWGKRRNSDWSQLTATTKVDEAARERGFTTHEHYDLFDLVDMNGRIYDPTLGRFISADPYIQDISNLQNYNRYSYVLNNPLTYSDPSGYFSIGPISFPNPVEQIIDVLNWITPALTGVTTGIDRAVEKGTKWIKENWKTVVAVAVAVAVTYFTGGLGAGLAGAIIAGAAGGFAGSFTGTLLNGGTVYDALEEGGRGAIIGGATAGLTYGVGSAAQSLGTAGNSVTPAGYAVKIAGHGLVQGGMSVAQGGKFSHSFYAGAVTGAFGPISGNIDSQLGQVAAAAALGGTVSVINGGKFGNGAVTGAYVQFFNELSHPGLDPGTSEQTKESLKFSKSIDETLKTMGTVTDVFGVADVLGGPGLALDVYSAYSDYNQSNYAGMVQTAAKVVIVSGTVAVLGLAGTEVLLVYTAAYAGVVGVSWAYNNAISTAKNLNTNLQQK